MGVSRSHWTSDCSRQVRDCAVVHGADTNHRSPKTGAGVVDRKARGHNGPTGTAPNQDPAYLPETVPRLEREDQVGTRWDT